eukprot:503809_1
MLLINIYDKWDYARGIITGKLLPVVNIISRGMRDKDVSVVNKNVIRFNLLIQVIQYSEATLQIAEGIIGNKDDYGKYVSSTAAIMREAAQIDLRGLLSNFQFILNPTDVTVDDIPFLASLYSKVAEPAITVISNTYNVPYIDPLQKLVGKKFQLYHGDRGCMSQSSNKYGCLRDEKKYFLSYHIHHHKKNWEEQWMVEYWEFVVETDTHKTKENILSVQHKIGFGKYYLKNDNGLVYGTLPSDTAKENGVSHTSKSTDMPVVIFEVGSVLIIANAKGDPGRGGKEFQSLYDDGGIKFKYGDPGARGFWFVNKIE